MVVSALALTANADTANTGADPITALLSRDWAALGGWSLFIGLGIFLIWALVTERLVPGARYRRLETSAEKNSDMLQTSVNTNEKLATANEIVKHFFEKTVPKRGDVSHDG